MAYLLIDGLGKDDKRDILSYLRDGDAVHVYAVCLYHPDDEEREWDLFNGYDTYVVSDTPLTEGQKAVVIQQDPRYVAACEKWLEENME